MRLMPTLPTPRCHQSPKATSHAFFRLGGLVKTWPITARRDTVFFLSPTSSATTDAQTDVGMLTTTIRTSVVGRTFQNTLFAFRCQHDISQHNSVANCKPYGSKSIHNGNNITSSPPQTRAHERRWLLLYLAAKRVGKHHHRGIKPCFFFFSLPPFVDTTTTKAASTHTKL